MYSKFMHQYVISPTNENDAELNGQFLIKILPDSLKLRTKVERPDT